MNGASRARVVMVTGASGGLGSGLARRFAAESDIVYLGYHRGQERVDALAAELISAGGDARPARMDLTDLTSVDAAFDAILAEVPAVDVLVNNAAFRPIGPFLELDDEDWASVLGANVMGPVRCLRRVLPGMRDQGFGRIVNISGTDAIEGWGNRAHVTVSKAGLQGLTRAVAVEFAPFGITANTVLPGSFRTPRDPAIYPDWERMRQFLVAHTPLGRQGEPTELAGLCWWLTTPDAAYVTGQDLHINGGSWPLRTNPLL